MKGIVKKQDNIWCIDFYTEEVSVIGKTLRPKTFEIYQEHFDKESKYYLKDLSEGEEVEFEVIDEFTHPEYFVNIGWGEGRNRCLITKRNPKYEIPKYDPYTGELNPYYEELTGKKDTFCDEYKLKKSNLDVTKGVETLVYKGNSKWGRDSYIKLVGDKVVFDTSDDEYGPTEFNINLLVESLNKHLKNE